MFETLDPPAQTVTRRWPLLMNGTYAVVGLGFLLLGLLRHQPFRLVIGAAMLLMSLTWLVTTVKSTSPMTNRQFRVRTVILILLLVAEETAYA